jgi:hypothetical protein
MTEQNLTVLGLSTKTGGDIAHCTDRGVAGALGEPDLAQCRVRLCLGPGAERDMVVAVEHREVPGRHGRLLDDQPRRVASTAAGR